MERVVTVVAMAAVLTALAGAWRRARTAPARVRVRRLRPAASPSSRRRSVVNPVARLLTVRRDARELARGMPDALDEVARSLRSGASLTQALAEVEGSGGGAGAALAELGRRGSYGAGVAEEARRWALTTPTPEVRAATVAVTLGAAGAATPSLGVEAVAAGLRARHTAAAEVRAQSAQARLSAAVLSVLPVAFGAWVAASQPHALTFLIGTSAGLGCLTAGLSLEAAGLLWIRAILRDAL